MPSEFDSLIAELRVGQAVTGLRPDQRRVIEGQIAEMTRPVPVGAVSEDADHNGIADDKEIQAAAAEGRRRSDAEAFIRDGAANREAQRRSSATLSKALRDMLASAAKAEAGAAELRVMNRAMRRERARESARDALAKALSAFHAGALTAHQVCVIEARAHRVMAMATETSR